MVVALARSSRLISKMAGVLARNNHSIYEMVKVKVQSTPKVFSDTMALAHNFTLKDAALWVRSTPRVAMA